MLNKKITLTIFALSLLRVYSVYSQQEKPLGVFIDTIAKVGTPIQYSLSFRHRPDIELFFPDSSYSFSPFEYISRRYYPTKTIDGISLDSVVYLLRTFELSSSLDLSLPVYSVDQGDTSKVLSSSDKITILQYDLESKDSIKLVFDDEFLDIKKQFNYPYYIAYAVGFILIAFLFYIFLGKLIIRNYKVYKMHSNHISFIRTFDKLQYDLQQTPNLVTMEKVLGEWKSYLTKLEQKPINTFTTPEIIMLFNKEELKDNLQEIDRSIYSGSITENPYKAFMALKKFSNKRYKKRRKELKNAR